MQGENYSVSPLRFGRLFGRKIAPFILRSRVFVLVSGVGILSQALLSGAPAVSYLSLATWEDTNFLFGSSVLTADV